MPLLQAFISRSLLLSLGGVLFFHAPALSQAPPPVGEKENEQIQQLKKLADERLCDPESEMYCRAHTVFIQDDYALVVASVERTPGVFILYQRKGQRWGFQQSFTLLSYAEQIQALENLAPRLKTYFIQQLDAKYKKKKELNPSVP